jgi:fatty-acyl-CoA synthase
MATWNEDGYFLIVDRKKDIIVSGGENISSLEVEKILLSHPAVLEVAIIPVPDPVWGEVPKALVVLKPNIQAGEIELIEHCRSRLAHYKCPRSVEYLESLPRTGTGKVLKRDLRKKYWHGKDTIHPEFSAGGGSAATPESKSTSASSAAKRAAQTK